VTPGQRLTLAAGNVRVALKQRDQAIRDMRAEGATLRQIATTAGLTAGGVKKILDRKETTP
jgi:hypothetical protein